MESRKLDEIHALLMRTEAPKKSLFGRVSAVTKLTHPPTPLTTAEMHKTSGDIIRNAHQEVLMSFYKFNAHSDAGQEIVLALQELKAKAEARRTIINVNLIVNKRGKIAELLYKANEDLGIESITSSEFFNIKIVDHTTAAFGSLHSRMIIVDSNIAMIRGGDAHTDNNLDRHLIETAALLRGPIVAEMRQDFSDVWQAYTSKPLSPSRTSSPSLPSAKGSPVSSSSSSPEPQVSCLFLSKRENGNVLYFKDCDSPYKIALVHAINTATASINIMTENLNDADICKALAQACSRGVQVKIILGMHQNDATEKYWGGTNLESIASIVNQVEIRHQQNLQIRWAANSEGNVVDQDENYTLQAKYACIDSSLVFMGSSPMDAQALKYAREADVIFEDHSTAVFFDAKLFDPVFARGKNYFQHAYMQLLISIEVHLKRIEGSSTSEVRKTKAVDLRAILKDVAGKDCDYNTKLYLLLNQTLPVLQIKTGSKPGNPTSYNSTMLLTSMYGLCGHLNIPAAAAVPTSTSPSNLIRHSILTRSSSSGELRRPEPVVSEEPENLLSRSM